MSIPHHIVIVPDGNRRWAKKKGLPSFAGHRKGAKVIETILQTALDLHIPALTMWGCSVSNITKRTPQEVRFLLQLFKTHFNRLLKSKELLKHGVRIRMVGRWEELFPRDVQKPMRALMEKTKGHTKHHLTFLMAYDGRDEMQNTIERIAALKTAKPDLSVTKDLVKQNLWTHDLPPVDLVIRTGGEPHWSAGLMMWDVAEAHLYFTKTLWPDFSPEEFTRAVTGQENVERRFGA